MESPLLPEKLAAIADTQPSIAATLAKTLDKLVAGEDIRPQAPAKLATPITPEIAKWAQQRLSIEWPRGKLTLLKRTPVPDQPEQFTSTFRLSKGTEALLIVFSFPSD